MLKTALDENGEPERIVQIAALDPFLTIDLLYLANSLRTDPKELVGTAREAVRVVGAPAIRRFTGLLADTGSPKVPSDEKMERVVRRSALSTAVAARTSPRTTASKGRTRTRSGCSSLSAATSFSSC